MGGVQLSHYWCLTQTRGVRLSVCTFYFDCFVFTQELFPQINSRQCSETLGFLRSSSYRTKQAFPEPFNLLLTRPSTPASSLDEPIGPPLRCSRRKQVIISKALKLSQSRSAPHISSGETSARVGHHYTQRRLCLCSLPHISPHGLLLWIIRSDLSSPP